MTRIATKDTFGFVRVGDNETRHQIIAGQEIPDVFEDVPEDAYKETERRPIDGLAPTAYKDEQRTQRLRRDNTGRIDSEYEPEEVGRAGTGADDPLAEGEEKLANDRSPLANERLKAEAKTSAERAKEADEETRKSRESELKDGKTPAQRIEERLKGGAGQKRQQRSRRGKAPDAPAAEAASGEERDTDGSSEAPGDN